MCAIAREKGVDKNVIKQVSFIQDEERIISVQGDAT